MKINVLDKSIAELIAAGEVVERPASIIKELVENSIDAGATSITVEIKGGGVRFIRVADNGHGIEKDEVPKAFLRHATSKVRTADDLDGILTLGFRGEALASIAAVCKVELTTKTNGDGSGITYKIEGGEFTGELPAGCPVGTAITVRDVFFNTPARMKFLKKDVGEGNAVAQVIDKCALSHPEISFRFIRDGQIKLRTSGNGDLRAVLMAIYGAELAGQMLPVDYRLDGGLTVKGFISKPAASKPSRAYQNFFINGRYVRTRTASAALEEAFKGKVIAGKFPACAINIGIMAERVDVNVHPAKIEVRFNDERPVFSAVYYGAKSALETMEPAFAPAPRISSAKGGINELTLRIPAGEYKQERLTTHQVMELFKAEVSPKAGGFITPARLSSASLDVYVEDEKGTCGAAGFYENMAAGSKIIQNDILSATKTTETGTIQKKGEPPLPERRPSRDYRMIGELFGCYILLEEITPGRSGDSLVLVDKHAAHERIIYERLIKGVSYGSRQVLLTPVSVTLSKDEYGAAAENLEAFEKLGFLAEDFGDGTVLVREIPIELGESDIAQVTGEITSRILKGGMDFSPETLDKLYYSIACKSAVRSGDKNSAAELNEILERLAENPQITHCPHGRPVSVRISRREIEKMFGRQA